MKDKETKEHNSTKPPCDMGGVISCYISRGDGTVRKLEYGPIGKGLLTKRHLDWVISKLKDMREEYPDDNW